MAYYVAFTDTQFFFVEVDLVIREDCYLFAVYAMKGETSQRGKSRELSGRLNFSPIDVFNAPFLLRYIVWCITLLFKTCIMYQNKTNLCLTNIRRFILLIFDLRTPTYSWGRELMHKESIQLEIIKKSEITKKEITTITHIIGTWGCNLDILRLRDKIILI